MANKKPEWNNAMKNEGLDDMTLLSKVTNDQILENLKKRFEKDIIYTNIGDVLISVNPFKPIPIYTDEILHEYEGKSRIELPPHVFSIAEQTYRSMINEKENQCVIISGESGAGKTEAAKKIMQYIAEVSGEKGSTSNKKVEHVKSIILETNPLLEAFGNAKTLRNNNSSRFGKYFEIQFNKTNEPEGGKITNYLLEKSRVVFQLNGERNFHIFYQFCRGATKKEQEEFGIYGPENFAYLTKGNTLDIDGVDDVEEFAATRHAMNVIGITAQEQYNIFKLIAGILWLGNVDFIEQAGDKSSVADQSVLEFTAQLLNVPANFLKTTLEVRQLETKHGNQRGTQYNVPLNKTQAISGRDALAKAIYDRLFNWLVERVNQAMENPNVGLMIGVLDIYGFEVFDRNGFEQFCINYVNEKLQQIFIEFTLKMEQEEYVREGIKWEPIQFFDNKIVCELIEGKNPPGIFSILDDVCRAVHSQSDGADKSLLQRIAGCKSNPHFDARGNAFCVKHYAGDVIYEGAGMIEKNKDTLLKDHLELLQISTNQFLVGLFPDVIDQDSKKLPTTAGFKIKSQANDLVSTLMKSTPHYIRCLKSNDIKKPNVFDGPRVLHQIKYLGLLDNIKVRRAGFAYRTFFQKFMERYYLLSDKTCYAGANIWKGDALGGCRAILQSQNVEQSQYQIGKTKIFIRYPEMLFALEETRERYWHDMASRIKNAYRNYKAFQYECSNRIKNAFRNYKLYRQRCAQTIQGYYRAWKQASPYFDLRMQTEQLIQGRKERQRFSMISVRKFYGDYLDVRSQTYLLDAMAEGRNEEVVFSAKCQIIVHPLLSGNKMSPRFFIMTKQAIYLIKLKQKKNLAQYLLDRRLPLSEVQSFTMSNIGDNYLFIHAPMDFDIAMCCDFKTELVALINKTKGSQLPINFSPEVEYQKKKKSNNTCKFLKDEMHKEPFFKKNTVHIASQLPPSTTVNKPRKNPSRNLSSGGGSGSGAPKKLPPPGAIKPKAAASKPMPTPGGAKKMAPAPGGAPAKPMPTPGAKKMAPAPGGAPAKPMPTPGVAKTMPTPGAAKPMPTPGAAKPMPTPGAAKPMPTPGAVKPMPTPGAGKPMPTPGAAKPPGGRGGPLPTPGAPKPAGGPKPAAAKPAAPPAEKYKAVYDYDAQQPDELTFKENDIIILVKKVDNDWWQGDLRGKVGMFPSNYVEKA
ncbi:myosin IC [Heterostelium album PN500]|uniref:Myosin IC n=1 Tax=Heterostelium pallidum (strain ATCC 26659 / Pp 5 / PN500) TaxID=670386 RepID=D3BKB9_HETP5|nr:myosin IC [Heterostelium album PN500]EFA78349.1 myosin IC [Heterostelium album PN500]|eukprot:XP_020430474.1 myosin IC [Heterostelium album PN500]